MRATSPLKTAKILTALEANGKTICLWLAQVSPDKNKKGLILLSLWSSVGLFLVTSGGISQIYISMKSDSILV